MAVVLSNMLYSSECRLHNHVRMGYFLFLIESGGHQKRAREKEDRNRKGENL